MSSSERPYKRQHSKDEDEACCLGNFTQLDREECLADFPKEIIKQNQYILNLLHQFGNSSATNEKELEEVHFKLLGRCVCEDCLCVIYGLSDWRYERIKNFYRVGAKVIFHGNKFHHHCKTERAFQAGAWLENYVETHSEPMPHADIFHLHVASKKSVFGELEPDITVSRSTLYKCWNKKVKIPTKNHIFARCPLCQGLRKRTFEAGKSARALEALEHERKQHKELYMAEKNDYYKRQIRSVHQPDDIIVIIYDGMHKEKTKLPRFALNPSKDLEGVPRVPCNLLGFICHRQGLKNYNKQGIAFLNIAYPDNANFILSSLLHSIQSVEVGPFSRDLSCQFDNASNNKCNVAIGFFGYLISEGVFYNVYGNTLLVHHTHEDVDRMFENANEQFRKADMVTPNELSLLMKNVPYVTKVGTVPCVWDINSFITPFIRTVHDFGNVHHFWLHKSVEGNVVLHYKRYSKDQWLPNSEDPTTYLLDEDKYGILVFREKPHGIPKLVQPSFQCTEEELHKVKSSIPKLFDHPLLQDSRLEDRKLWWTDFLAGKAFKPHNSTWPIEELKKKRAKQNLEDKTSATKATEGLQHFEDDMPLVYSGQYLDPSKKDQKTAENLSMDKGQWPVKKIIKERIK